MLILQAFASAFVSNSGAYFFEMGKDLKDM